MSNVAAYIRVSTEEQAREGFSVASQIEKCNLMAQMKELPTPELYNDAGYSGGDQSRPAFGRLLADIKAGKVKHVIIWRLDRLTRRMSELLDVLQLVQDYEVELLSVSETFDTASSGGRMATKMLGVVNEYFLELLSENIKAGLHKRAAEGKWVSSPPTGADIVDGVLVWNERSRAVKKAFELAAGDMYLNAVGRKTGINPATLRGILRNPAYIGKMLLKGEVLDAAHEPLISKELFEMVQKVKPVTTGKWNNKASHVLSGTVRCGLCRRAMSVQHGGRNREVVSYVCRHRGGRACEGVGSRSAAKVERGFLAGAELLKTNKQLREDIKNALHDKKPPNISKEIAEANKELGQIKRQVSLATKYMLEKESTAEVWSAKLEELTEYRKILESDRDALVAMTHEKERKGLELGEMLDLFDQTPFAEIWEEGEFGERRAILTDYAQGIYLYPDYMEVKFFNVPPFKVWWDEIGRTKVCISMERERRVA